MARVAVFDCFSGIAGDMALAALLDAGAPLAVVDEGLARLPLPPFTLEPRHVMRGGLRALHLRVSVSREQTFQPAEMRAMVRSAAFAPRATHRMLAAIDALEAGEAEAHASDAPHLHEAGGVDAVIDICGTMLALEALGVEAAFCPVVTVGSGTIARTSHGPIPAAPGPAAAAILARHGFTQRFVEAAHELVTPTGAALLAAVARPAPALIRAEAWGAGAGTFDPPWRPNALRVALGEMAADLTLRDLRLLEANIDDMSAALLAHARDRLLAEGALDAWLEPIAMKKGRAASKLCALARPEDEARLAGLFLRETTTLGVRVTPYQRYEAAREALTIETPFGPARAKRSTWQGHQRLAVEYDEIVRIAAATGLPALEVQRRIDAAPGEPPPGTR